MNHPAALIPISCLPGCESQSAKPGFSALPGPAGDPSLQPGPGPLPTHESPRPSLIPKIPAFWCISWQSLCPLPSADPSAARAATSKCRALPPRSPASSVACPVASRRARSRDSPARCQGRPACRALEPSRRERTSTHESPRPSLIPKIPAFWCLSWQSLCPLSSADPSAARAATSKCRALPREARLLQLPARLRVAEREAGILRAATAGRRSERVQPAPGPIPTQ